MHIRLEEDLLSLDVNPLLNLVGFMKEFLCSGIRWMLKLKFKYLMFSNYHFHFT